MKVWFGKRSRTQGLEEPKDSYNSSGTNDYFNKMSCMSGKKSLFESQSETNVSNSLHFIIELNPQITDSWFQN